MGWSESDSGSVRYRPNQSIFIPENTTLYAVWEKIEAPSTNDPIYDFDVKIQCISDSNHHDYETSPRHSCETTFGSVYYSEEKKLYLCDMTINAKDIINIYSSRNGKKHDFYPDPNISTKVITLYYDENEISNYRKWKKLDEPGNPVIFKVTCANKNLGYRVNHEYYKRDKDNKLILEDVIRSEVEQNIRLGTSYRREQIKRNNIKVCER